jgi:hypothetical protein
MRFHWHAILAAAALAAAQGPAHATCYFVLDRNDNTIYRDTQPPVDMSDRGAAERDAMRARGEYLLFFETEACAPLTFVIGPGVPGTLSVDAIVAGIPSMTTSEQAAAASASGFTRSTTASGKGVRSAPARSTKK